MNGDRLLIDRSGPGRSINMRVVISDKQAQDKSRDWTLKAPMPPNQPTTLSEEIRARRLARQVAKIDPGIYDHVREYVWSLCDVDDSVDVTALEKDLQKYFAKTSMGYDGLGRSDDGDI
jgi:hypothetical protein